MQFNLDILDLRGLPTSGFSLVNPPAGNILTVAPESESTLQVRFSPTADGARLAELGFTAVGGGDAPPSVSLDGTGTNTDPFTQPDVQPDCTIAGTPRGERLTGTSSAVQQRQAARAGRQGQAQRQGRPRQGYPNRRTQARQDHQGQAG
jgi:hypothetical protein